MVAFEAAVAGGIPVIKALREGLAATASSGLPASSTAPATSS
jgi:homoserine dehydrogenase